MPCNRRTPRPDSHSTEVRNVALGAVVSTLVRFLLDQLRSLL